MRRVGGRDAALAAAAGPVSDQPEADRSETAPPFADPFAGGWWSQAFVRQAPERVRGLPSCVKSSRRLLIQRHPQLVHDLVDMRPLGDEHRRYDGRIPGELAVAAVPEQVLLHLAAAPTGRAVVMHLQP